jgi:hypothetical protein
VGRRVGLIIALALCAGCDPWRCDFHVRGACIEFETDPPDLEAAQVRVEQVLALELPFWGLSKLDGWRIQYRDSVEYPCYMASRNEGCTDYLEKTLSVHVPDGAPGCFEAAELLHELGHYELGDPIHSAARWQDVDGMFASVVWERPDAPSACVSRYRGIRSGVWAVRPDRF